MLHETICNDNFLPNTALQCWNNVATIRNNVATMLYSDAVSVLSWCSRSLRWCYTRRFATTIFCPAQRCNVGTMWQPLETMSQQCCTVMLCCANITFRNELYAHQDYFARTCQPSFLTYSWCRHNTPFFALARQLIATDIFYRTMWTTRLHCTCGTEESRLGHVSWQL